MDNTCRFAMALVFLIAGSSAAATTPSNRNPQADTPAAQLHALFARAWSESGHDRHAAGTGDYKSLWGDPGIAHEQAEAAETRANLAALKKIDFGKLDPTDQLSYRLFEYQLNDAIAGNAFADQAQGLITQLWGPQLAGEEFRDAHGRDAKSYQRLVRKLDATGDYLAAFTRRMQQAMAKGIIQPRAVMERVPDEIKANIAQDPTQSPFYAPFKNLPDAIPANERAKLQADAQRAIVKVVNPAYAKFLAFFQDDYLPHARTKAGVSNLPGGKAYYAYLVRHYTTTDMTPDQVHAMGLQLVTRIHGQMEAVFRQIGFKGSYKDFVHYLRTDPRFYYANPDDLLEAYRAAAKRIDPHLTEVLSLWLQPRQPWGVEVIPAALAPNTYPAYANVPYMSVNLYKPESRPKYEIQVLTCHEGRPGHNLQIPVAEALDELPEFRRHAYYNAFGEGWALYSETLCDKPMGLYDKDPYAKFGYLDYQMWRAVRLVVDTGIHEDGWTREQAVKYMQDNTALSDQNIATEVDRYIVWPGQALSYMIGEQTILSLRDEARKKLGAKYDLRDFDDVVLGQGSLPMAVLKDVVNRWIDNTLAGKPADQLPYACKPRSTEACLAGTAPAGTVDTAPTASTVTVLGRSVAIRYGAGVSGSDRSSIDKAFSSAAILLDRHAKDLDAPGRMAIAQIRKVDVTGSPDTCLGETGGHAMQLSVDYLRTVSPSWLASIIGHEGQHFLDAGRYPGSLSWKDEQKATQTQLGIGRAIGFDAAAIRYLEHWGNASNRAGLQAHMKDGYPPHCLAS